MTIIIQRIEVARQPHPVMTGLDPGNDDGAGV
jgi:hypothetical protein